MNDPPSPVLAIGSHPDDVEFGCGATIAQWAARGAEVHIGILTDGSKGTWRVDEDLEALVARRREESQAAGEALGAVAVHHGGFVDGELSGGAAEREVVVRWIREVRPEVVLGHDPWKRYRLHPDHRHAGFATVDGIVAARDPHFFPDLGGPHHRPSELWLFEADEPDHVEPVADLDAKLTALLEHRSQWRSTMGIEAGSSEEAAQRAAFRARLESTARAAGQALGPGGPQLGETFRRMTQL